MYWQPGQKLKTRPYQIEAMIGQGGFGVTYKARHLELQHQVVLKTPNAMLRNDPAYKRFEERFRKEGQMLAQLSQQAHPSIVRVSDLFTEDDIPCLVMDLVPGGSLFDLVQERGPLPETQAVECIRQIADALVVSHDIGIVHRDAHALNIMVANQNRAVLIDFGIAGDIAPMVSNTRNAFNPAFAPYEQILGGGGLPTVDVYSLGAALYYAVTGQLPTPAAKRKLDNLALVPPKQHNPQISDKLQAAIIQAMALEAADRPQTMRDFLALLQPNQQAVVMATQKAMPPPTQPSPQVLSPQPLPKQKQPAAAKTSTDLRGYFILPEMKTQGMVRQLGRGYIQEVIALNQELTIVIAGGGAALFNLRTGEALWEIDCPASSGAMSADGRLLGLIGDKDIYLWDLATGQFLRQFQGHTSWVNSVSFSPDGKTLASGGEDKTVRLWDVATGRELKQLTGHTDWVNSVSFSPDGKTLASGSGWKSRRMGNLDKTLRLWDVATGRELKQLTLTGHTSRLTRVAFSPNGQILASWNGSRNRMMGNLDKTVRLWDVATGRELKQLTGDTDWVLSVSFSPDGQILASGSSDKTVRLWDVATGQELKQLTGHTGEVKSVAFGPNGQILASASADNTVQLWDVATGRELQQLTLTVHTSRLTRVAFSPNGQILASGSSDKTVRLWDVATGRELKQLTGHTHYVYNVAFSPDGQILASGSGDKTVRLWDVATGRELQQLTGNVATFSPNGQILTSGSRDKTVRLWDVATGRQIKQLTLAGHTNSQESVAFSPNGQILASVSEDFTVRLWDVATGRQIKQLTGHTDDVRSFNFSPDGKTLASGSSDETVRLWDVATGQFLRQLTGHTHWVSSVSFSPDGKYLASGSYDKTVRLWDVATGRELRQLTGHTSWVNSVSFSPNGQTLASGSHDKTVRLWDLATGRELRQFQGNIVSFSPDGKILASRDGGVIRLWRL